MSIFHLSADLAGKRRLLKTIDDLEEFPFSEQWIERRWEGKFPDIVVRVDHRADADSLMRGGELIELKDSKAGYSVASFNSTIPTGAKDISAAGIKCADADIMPRRHVYYLLRGRRKRDGAVKVCLVHGSFFETVKVRDLIAGAFRQAIDSADVARQLSDEEKSKLAQLMSSQEIFSSSRKVDKSSVSLRFRVMSEVRKEANILKNYPEIQDNTLNLIVPLHCDSPRDRDALAARIDAAAKRAGVWDDANSPFVIKHPFNGYFRALQEPLA